MCTIYVYLLRNLKNTATLFIRASWTTILTKSYSGKLFIDMVSPQYILINRENHTELSNPFLSVDSHLTEWFDVLAGVKQRDVISPILFNIMIDCILLRSSVDELQEEGVMSILQKSSRHPASYNTDREFADDITATSM